MDNEVSMDERPAVRIKLLSPLDLTRPSVNRKGEASDNNGLRKRNKMRQIINRMAVAVTMCAVTSLIKFASLIISPSPLLPGESVWVMRLFLAALLSPVLYSFLDKRTSTSGWHLGTALTSKPPFLKVRAGLFRRHRMHRALMMLRELLVLYHRE